MFKLYIWLTVLQCVTGSPLGKIFGGQLASIKDYPFFVNLRRSGRFRCGGSLISSSCVLTAAHCLESRHQFVNDLTIHAQQECLGDSLPQQHVRMAWYATTSPNYCSSCSLDSDIAVIKLSRPFHIAGNARLVKIDFNQLPDKSNLTIIGWGSTSDEKPRDIYQCLQAAHVQLVPQRECISTIGKMHPMTKNMFCAIGDNSTDACQGDSGGPVLYENRQVGIVSWGLGCGSGFPGVYTQLSSPPMNTFLKYFMERHC